MKNNKLICLDHPYALYELQALETISSTKQSNLHVAGHFKQLIQVLPYGASMIALELNLKQPCPDTLHRSLWESRNQWMLSWI